MRRHMPSGSALALVLSTSEFERHFLQLVRKERRRSLPETKWRTLIYRLGKVGDQRRQSVYVVSEAEWTRHVDLRYNGG